MSLIVFTDLDGSLLDHHSYSLAPARDALDVLSARKIPLIPISSKTAAEILRLKAQEKLPGDFIYENGAALQRASGEFVEFGETRCSWLERIHSLRDRHDYLFAGFSDWSVKEVEIATGLDTQGATMAMARSYSEPILWMDSLARRQEFETELHLLGLSLQEGGRFLSIQSRYDKSDAMRWIKTRTASMDDKPLVSVALGDSPNDLAMLHAADIAVIIRSEKSALMDDPPVPLVIRTEQPGPKGWQQAVAEILHRYDTDNLFSAI